MVCKAKFQGEIQLKMYEFVRHVTFLHWVKVATKESKMGVNWYWPLFTCDLLCSSVNSLRTLYNAADIILYMYMQQQLTSWNWAASLKMQEGDIFRGECTWTLKDWKSFYPGLISGFTEGSPWVENWWWFTLGNFPPWINPASTGRLTSTGVELNPARD